jgi:hypothetical protein
MNFKKQHTIQVQLTLVLDVLWPPNRMKKLVIGGHVDKIAHNAEI